ncbi:MAG: methyltransferase domain-containing protein [Candidatus Brocadiaceae bacterium]|nr:methyltransferase domain-containing protein [Candidatus Brocadiaceae bacterium]
MGTGRDDVFWPSRIGADRGASKEFVEHGANGFLFKSGNDESHASFILKFYEEEELRKQFGERDKAWINKNANYNRNLGEPFYAVLTDKKKDSTMIRNNIIEIKCPICSDSSNKLKSIGKPELSSKAKTVFKETYQVQRCQNCRFYFVSPQNISDAEMSKLYDEQYFSEMTAWWAKRRERDRRNRLNKLQAFSKGKIKHFLDVGCGEGYVLLEAADRGWKAHGIDVFDNRVDTAKREDIRFTGGDLFTAKFPDNYFDAVYMDSVLEHIFNPVDYLKEIRRILTRGG